MPDSEAPVTPAVRVLRQHKVPYTEYLYDYEPRSGTAGFAAEFGVDEHAVVKTLVMEDETKAPLIVLMHGDREVSVRDLGRQTGRRHIKPCTPEAATKHTGYLVGGTSPLGTKKPMPVYIERSVLGLEKVYLNGGKRGFIVALDPKALVPILGAQIVEVGR